MRRLAILGVLYALMTILLPLGQARHGSVRLFTFGFLILAAYSIGEMAAEARLPKMVGYIGAGALFGPSLLNVVTIDAVRHLTPLSSLAISLIAFLAGAELRWEEVRTRAAAIAKILTVELSLTFVAVTAVVFVLGNQMPFLVGQPMAPRVVFALLFASIAIVHSPAVTMALLSETKAEGPVARTTLGVVLVSDVVVVLVFSAALALARVVAPPRGADAAAISLAGVIWEILGAVLVGSMLGAAVAMYLRIVRRELLLFSVIVAFGGAAIAKLLHVETMLTLISAGFATQNLSRLEHTLSIRRAMERAAAPVFVVFFALAGAQMALGDLASMWLLVLPIVVVRMLSIWIGTSLGARWAMSGPEGRKIWLGLVSQAGVAIGLASVAAQAYPRRGAQIRTVMLAVIAINEVIGPILFRHALVSSGEVTPPARPPSDPRDTTRPQPLSP